MTAKLSAFPKGHAHEHEEDPREHLMFDPRPREEMNRMVLESMQDTPLSYWVVVGVLGLLVLVALFGAWGYMISKGMGVAGIRRPVYWGVFIANFVFWIGISHAGTFVSAILRVFKAEFRRPFTRAAELMTTFGLAAAGLYPLIHLGRTWRFYWMIPYPNQRWLWPNFHSPLMWDMLAITTYLLSSTIYLYLPLIPDLAMARDHTTGWRQKMYRVLALGWRGTEAEFHHLHTAINIFAFAIIPVMFSVHTIVAWDFAVAMTVGWHSTIFGPYFVVGAIFSGVSAVTMVLALIRGTMKHMKYFIRPEHFDALGKLVLIFSMSWAYFFFNDFNLEWYGGEATGRSVMGYHLNGPFSWIWYGMLIANIVIPWATLWNKKIRSNPWLMFVISFIINLGMYAERFMIVTFVLSRGRMPFDWGWYKPSLVELSISLGSIALFLFLYAVMSRLIPLIPVWEVQEGQLAHTLRRIGKADVPTISELE